MASFSSSSFSSFTSSVLSRACCAGWVAPTALLCVYGFCSMMRPIEPFMTEFLTGAYKNLTTEQVTHQVYPVWTYSSLILLVPVLLLTDVLRYKPVVVLQGATYVAAFLLLLAGPGVRWAQLAFFTYSISMAADVAYFSYIYSVVPPACYQRATSYVRGAMLLGYAAGALLSQLLVSLAGVSLYCLAVVTLISVSMATVTSLFLPMPKATLFPKETHSAGIESDGFLIWAKTVEAVERVGRIFRMLVSDCRRCYSSAAVLLFCVWASTGRCGFYQTAAYVQLLWASRQPGNFTAYNGVVDGISTLTGAAATVAVGHVSLEWVVWGELVLGGLTLVISCSLFLMDLSRNIWVEYACFALFKTLYMQLSTICTFQIARTLSRRRYGLVFGVNSFVGTVLQSVLTAVVINDKYLHLNITSQFFIYASYFAAIGLMFTVRGVYTSLHVRRQAGRDTQTERDVEGSRL